jgi:hypothetical protein
MFFKKKSVESLMNCAFCGGAPRLIKCGDQREFLVYQCSRCFETPVRFWEAKLSERAARKYWNQRTLEAAYIINIYNWVKRGLKNREDKE